MESKKTNSVLQNAIKLLEWVADGIGNVMEKINFNALAGLCIIGFGIMGLMAVVQAISGNCQH